MKQIICIWLPNWPIQRLVSAAPELRGRSVILYEPARSGVPTVVACSPSAGALGIRAGMPLAEARGLAEASAGAESTPSHGYCRVSDRTADRRSLEELAAWCQQFSPWVGLDSGPQPEGLLLDMTGLATLMGDMQAVTERIGQAFWQRGLAVRMALANTVGAAWALAHFGHATTDGTECAAGQGSGRHGRQLAGAEEIVFAAAKHGFSDLQSLPVAALRLVPETIATLAQLGIVEIGQLAALPRAELTCRFGSELVTRLDQAAGAVEEVIQAYHAEPALVAQRILEFPTTRAKVLATLLKALIAQVAAQLDASGHGALQLVCRFYGHCHSQPPATLTVGLFRPSAVVEHLWDLVQMQLAQLRIDQPIDKVSVEVSVSAPLNHFQKRLFDDGQAQCDQRQLATLVDRLTGRLGRDQVSRVRMVADAQPEYGFRSASMTIRQDGAGATAGRQRPLYLLPRPQLLEVELKLADGPPVRFPVSGRQHCLARYWGPERIETGWWRKDPVRRDYYRVETTTGHRFWLFRRLADGDWFLHGVFA